MTRWLPWIPAFLVGLAMLATFGWALSWRLPYPYDLEWMEGANLTHAWRLQRGLPLYPEPGADWIPFAQAPGYTAALALTGPALGAPAGRVISLLGTLLAIASLTWIVQRHGEGRHRGALAVLTGLLFLGTWSDSGTFMDLAHPDALGVGLLLAGLAASLEPGIRGPLIGGLLIAGATYVKVPLAAFILPITLGLWIRDRSWRGAGSFAAASLVPVLAGFLALHLLTSGTFLTYLLAVPASHPLRPARAFPGAPWELASALPIALVLIAWWGLRSGPRSRWSVGLSAAAAVVITLLTGPVGGPQALGPIDATIDLLPRLIPTPEERLPTAGAVAGGIAFGALSALIFAAARALRHRQLDRRLAAPLLIGATAIVLSALLRSHVGAFLHVHLPAMALIALGAGLAAASLTASRPRLVWLVGLLIAAQLGWSFLRTPTARYLPSAADREAGDRLITFLRTLDDGPLWSPVAPWLAVQAGHEPGPHLIAIWDTANHPTGPWPDTGARVEQAVLAGRWRYVMDTRRGIGLGIDESTVHRDRLPIPSRTLWPKAGWPTRPAQIKELAPVAP